MSSYNGKIHEVMNSYNGKIHKGMVSAVEFLKKTIEDEKEPFEDRMAAINMLLKIRESDS